MSTKRYLLSVFLTLLLVATTWGQDQIPPGEDCWKTQCGETQISFADMPIPADWPLRCRPSKHQW